MSSKTSLKSIRCNKGAPREVRRMNLSEQHIETIVVTRCVPMSLVYFCAPFPLTPALSLRERGNAQAVLEQGFGVLNFPSAGCCKQHFRIKPDINSCFPLPKGEGSRVRGNATRKAPETTICFIV
jgi:hypothetical protein